MRVSRRMRTAPSLCSGPWENVNSQPFSTSNVEGSCTSPPSNGKAKVDDRYRVRVIQSELQAARRAAAILPLPANWGDDPCFRHHIFRSLNQHEKRPPFPGGRSRSFGSYAKTLIGRDQPPPWLLVTMAHGERWYFTLEPLSRTYSGSFFSAQRTSVHSFTNCPSASAL